MRITFSFLSSLMLLLASIFVCLSHLLMIAAAHTKMRERGLTIHLISSRLIYLSRS